MISEVYAANNETISTDLSIGYDGLL